MRPLFIALLLVAGCSSADRTLPDQGVVIADLSDCPNYNPSSGAGAGGVCTRPDAYCPYFEAYCHCNLQTSTWYCCDAGARRSCPSQRPSGPDCCRAFPNDCRYGCVGGVAYRCACNDDRWGCAAEACD